MDGKDRCPSQLAVNLNAALMGFNDGLRQRQAQPHTLGIFGKAAAVETLEDMVQVLWIPLPVSSTVIWVRQGDCRHRIRM